MTSLEFGPLEEGGYRARPSFRDLVAFTFQPQNIVANPDVMFFKADTTEHREKLKTIFPYVLGAVTPVILQARIELDRVARNLRRKEGELKALNAASDAWRLEAQGWLRQAMELGLVPVSPSMPEDWPTILELARAVVRIDPREAAPSLAGIDVALGRLEALRADETAVAAGLTEHRQRLNELRRLVESSEAYGGAIRIQRDRLALASWFRDLLERPKDADPMVALGDGGRDRVLALCDALDALEVRLRSHPRISDTLDKEILRRRALAEDALERLGAIRQEIGALERASVTARADGDRYDRVARFLGRLDQALRVYDAADQGAALRRDVEALRTEMGRLQRTVSEGEVRRKLRNALDRIEGMTARLVPRLDAEWPDAPVKLMIEDLTVKVVRRGRDDYLWEIGSGANWLAYHVALTLALQKFFLGEPHHPVPGLLIYDQPSQVYFPRRTAGDEAGEPVAWRDEDVVAVRKVFELLGDEALAANGRLQVIVLDHADEDVWGDLHGVQVTETWRGHGLVPSDWFVAGRG